MEMAVLSVAQSISAAFPKASDISELAFVGIQRHGVEFASRTAKALKGLRSVALPVGSLDISMYRDDIGMRKSLPTIHETVMPFDINGRVIILADDVLQSGRTIRAALDAINDYGRPGFIRLAVLIDRGLREFPIQADFVGVRVDVPPAKRVRVKWKELDGFDAVCSIDKSINAKDA